MFRKLVSLVTLISIVFSFVSPAIAASPSFDSSNIYAFINSDYLTGGNLDLAKSSSGYLVNRGGNGWGIDSENEQGNDSVEVNDTEIIAFDLGTGSGAYTIEFDVKHDRDTNYNYENFQFKAFAPDTSEISVTPRYNAVNPSKTHVILTSNEVFQYVAMIGGTDGLNIVLDNVTTVDIATDTASDSTVTDGSILGFVGTYTSSGQLDLSYTSTGLVNQKNGTNYIGTVGGAKDYAIDAVGEGLVFVLDGMANSATFNFKTLPTLYTVELYDADFNIVSSPTTTPGTGITVDASTSFKYVVFKYNGESFQMDVNFTFSGETEYRQIAQDMDVDNLDLPLNEAGDSFEYTYTFSNPGNTKLTGIQFTLDIPAEFENLNTISVPSGTTNSSATSGGANGKGYIDVSGISLEPGASSIVSYRVDAIGTLTYPDTATTYTSLLWPDTASSTATLTGELNVDFGIPNLVSSIAATDINGGDLNPGDCLLNTATITNSGSAIGSNLDVTLDYGTGTTFQTASGFTFQAASLDGSTIGSSIITSSIVVDSPYPTISLTISDLPVNIPEIFTFYTCVNLGYTGSVSPSIDAGIDGGITSTGTIDTPIVVTPAGNNIPTDISLSGSSIDENSATGTLIGTFSTTDADAGDTFTYSFATGTGDTDNARFTLSGSELYSAEPFDYESFTGASIRIQTNDGNGGTYEKIFIISIGDLDDEAPVITLTGSGTLQIIQGNSYSELGATWTDNVDGTGSILTASSGSVDVNTLGTYTLEYTYTDSSSNVGNTVTRMVQVVLAPDTEKPVITLTGSGTITLEVGTSYTDLGATWSDNVDGTGGVSASGSVDVNTPGTYVLTYDITDGAGNVADQVTRTIIIEDTTAPTTIPGTLHSTTTETGATITWQTNELTSSEILYGLTISTDSSSGEQDIAPKVLSHSVTLTDLQACTKYYYKAISRDASGNELIDGIYHSITKGCAGNAAVLEDTDTNIIPTGSGATGTGKLSLGTGNKRVELSVPVGYFDTGTGTCAGSGTYFQFKEIEKNPVISNFGNPVTKSQSVRTYDLSAYCTPGERIHNFDEYITISMSYSDTDISGMDEASLSIYRYDEIAGTWQELTSCSVDSVNNIITCETNHFSTFGIFGSSSPTSGGSSGGSPKYDKCDGVDTSGSIYDGKCEADEITYVIEEDEGEKEVDTPSEDTESQEENIKVEKEIEGEIKEYELSNTYESCPIIDNLLDETYDDGYESLLKDIEGQEYEELILRLEKSGVVNGTLDGYFQPGRKILRVEFLKMVLRSHCIEYRYENPENLDFIDVDTTSWQAKVIKKSVDLGIAVGDTDEFGNKIFRADDEITKIEATKILMRMALVQMGKEPSSSYNDIYVDWYTKYVNQGEYLGVLSPEEDNYMFYPEQGLDRISMVEYLYRVIRLYR